MCFLFWNFGVYLQKKNQTKHIVYLQELVSPAGMLQALSNLCQIPGQNKYTGRNGSQDGHASSTELHIKQRRDAEEQNTLPVQSAVSIQGTDTDCTYHENKYACQLGAERVEGRGAVWE